jgi:hypothetical protein
MLGVDESVDALEIVVVVFIVAANADVGAAKDTTAKRAAAIRRPLRPLVNTNRPRRAGTPNVLIDIVPGFYFDNKLIRTDHQQIPRTA